MGPILNGYGVDRLKFGKEGNDYWQTEENKPA